MHVRFGLLCMGLFFCSADEGILVDAAVVLQLRHVAVSDEFVGNGEDFNFSALFGMMLGKICLDCFAEATGFYTVFDGDDFLEAFCGDGVEQLAVQRLEETHIVDGGGDAFFGESVGGGQGVVAGETEADEGHVTPLSQTTPLPYLDGFHRRPPFAVNA